MGNEAEETVRAAADEPRCDQRFVRLEAELAKAQKDNDHLKQEWQKYRLALNRIAHPKAYRINPGHEAEIARRALVIGMDVDPLPTGAKSEPNA